MKTTLQLSVFLIVCYVGLSSGAPAYVGTDQYFLTALRPRSADSEKIYPSDEAETKHIPNLNELHVWDDKPIDSVATIPTFKPVIVDTSNHCPSCLPDAILGDRPRW